MNIDDPGRRPEHLAVRAETCFQLCLGIVHPANLLRRAIKHARHRHVPEFAVQRKLQKRSKVISGSGEAVGALVVVAECVPGRIFRKPVVGVQSLHLHRQVGEQGHALLNGLPHIQLDFMAEQQLFRRQIIGRRAVIQQ